MKNLRTAVLCAGIALCNLGALAQEKPVPVNEPDYNKPKLFAGLPEKIQVSTEDLSNLFTIALGKSASLKLSDDSRIQFQGEIVSSADTDQGTRQTMVIRSTNFEGARFNLSRAIYPDGKVVYGGRIMSFKHGDLYELKNQNGQYTLVKRNFYDLVNE